MCARDKIEEEVPAFSPDIVKSRFNSYAKSLKMMQIARLKQKHSIKNGDNNTKPSYAPDWMTITTTYSRLSVEAFAKFCTKLEKTNISRYLPTMRTVKHTSVFLAFMAICCIVSYKQTSEPSTERSKIWTLVYLTSFGMHFGTQVWMTMVSGLVLYFSLPRHVFGLVQENLFPAFYTYSTIISFVLIVSFVQIQNEIEFFSKNFVQVVALSIAFMIELIVRLYVAHPMVTLKHIKTRMEAAAGGGQEIGQHVIGDLIMCPHYMKILKRFRSLHSYTAIATLITVMCSIYHINYLAEKLCI